MWTSYGATERGHAIPLVVVMLLDDRRHRPRRADAVAAHDERLLLAVLVEERRAERDGVERAELEDVAELDRRLLERASPPHTAHASPAFACRMSAKLGL